MPFLTRQDLRTNYQLLGPGPAAGQVPVALIHGLGANLAFWYLGAVRHLHGRTLLLHDLRGHGASSMPVSGYGLARLAEDFREMLDDLGLERVHVVGHSHGAQVALAFALAHPGRVASLTVADTQIRALQQPMRLCDWSHWPRWKADLMAQGVSSFPPEESEINFRLLAELGPRGGAALAGGRGAQLAARAVPPPRLLVAPRSPDDGPPEVAALPNRRINLRARQMGARGNRQWQTLLETTTAGVELQDESALVLERMATLKVPTLLIYGELSHCLPTSDRLLALIPGARRIVVPGVGHFFPIIKPRLFARALSMFLAGVETSGTPDRRRFMARVLAARSVRMPGGGA